MRTLQLGEFGADSGRETVGFFLEAQGSFVGRSADGRCVVQGAQRAPVDGVQLAGALRCDLGAGGSYLRFTHRVFDIAIVLDQHPLQLLQPLAQQLGLNHRLVGLAVGVGRFAGDLRQVQLGGADILQRRN